MKSWLRREREFPEENFLREFRKKVYLKTINYFLVLKIIFLKIGL
jgi:hypothetical protein